MPVGMEVEGCHVDLTIQRWQKLTGHVRFTQRLELRSTI